MAKGGVITFDCGTAPVTIPVTSTLKLRTDMNTVIDGGGVITLDGGSAVQIMSFNSADFQANENRLTLQHLTVINGKMTPTMAIPTAPAPCSQGFDDGEGGALYMRDGNLTVIDSIFTNNQAALLGPDTGGGAIYVLGSKHGALIVGSTFTGNTASNGGGLGGLFTELDIYDCLFSGNKASGHGANNNDADQVLGDEQRAERDRLGRKRRGALQRRKLGERRSVRRRDRGQRRGRQRVRRGPVLHEQQHDGHAHHHRYDDEGEHRRVVDERVDRQRQERGLGRRRRTRRASR